MVAQEAWVSVALLLDGNGGEHQVLVFSHVVVGQHCPEAVFDELGHLVSYEFPVLACGRVASSFDAFVFLFQGPRLGACLDGDTLVASIREQWCSRVVEVLQLVGEVGRASEVKGELGPGGGAAVTVHEVLH